MKVTKDQYRRMWNSGKVLVRGDGTGPKTFPGGEPIEVDWSDGGHTDGDGNKEVSEHLEEGGLQGTFDWDDGTI